MSRVRVGYTFSKLVLADPLLVSWHLGWQLDRRVGMPNGRQRNSDRRSSIVVESSA